MTDIADAPKDTQAGIYRKRTITVSASRWWKIGDHASITQYFASGNAQAQCPHCNVKLYEHGCTSTGVIVCPGDWIMHGEQPVKDTAFQAMYELVERTELKPPSF